MGLSDYFVPARLDDDVAANVRDVALRLYQCFGCTGLSRIDIILRDGTPYVLEYNTSPGMTETSLTPMAAQAAGIEFHEFVERLIQLAIEERG